MTTLFRPSGDYWLRTISDTLQPPSCKILTIDWLLQQQLERKCDPRWRILQEREYDK